MDAVKEKRAVMLMLDALKEDMRRMEDAAIRTSNRPDIWQDQIIYWMCVAILHLLQLEIRRGERK